MALQKKRQESYDSAILLLLDEEKKRKKDGCHLPAPRNEPFCSDPEELSLKKKCKYFLLFIFFSS